MRAVILDVECDLKQQTTHLGSLPFCPLLLVTAHTTLAGLGQAVDGVFLGGSNLSPSMVADCRLQGNHRALEAAVAGCKTIIL